MVSSCVLVALTAGTLRAQQAPPPQQPATRPSSPQQPSTIEPPNKSVGQPVDPNKYVIGPEDVLQITVWREPDLSGVVAVRPDGKITRPFIGEVQAGGVSPAQLTKELTEKFAVYVNRP